MKKSPDKKAVAAKDNALVKEIAKFTLSELRLIAYCLAHYDSRKKEGKTAENRTFTARVSDLCDIFSMDQKSAYKVIKKLFISLGQKPLTVKEGDKTIITNWFSQMVYSEGAGEFSFRLNEDLEPYILDLGGNFTRYRLEDVHRFGSALSWKMYENLKRWLLNATWSVSLDDLRELLGVSGKYPRWVDFKKWVILPALKEINEFSDLEVTFEIVKQGRKIGGVVFFIDKKLPEDVINLPNEQKELFKTLLTVGLAEKTAREYAELAHQKEQCKFCIEKIPTLKERWSRNKKGSFVAYVTGVLKKELADENEEPHDSPPEIAPDLDPYGAGDWRKHAQ